MNFKKIERLLTSQLFYRSSSNRLSIYSTCLGSNHYETLGLPELCTQADIKRAFFEKSKELHPDKNSQNPENHQLFIAVNDAYSVLGKDQTRAVYDCALARERTMKNRGLETDCPRAIFRDDALWEHRDKRNDRRYQHSSYYGIKGMNKMPNYYIGGGVVLFMICGALLHFVIAKISTSRAQATWEKRDLLAGQNYQNARKKAEDNGNLRQLEFFMQELEEATARKQKPT